MNKTYKTYRTALEAKVAAVNNVRREINRIAPILIENFRPLIGQKVMKADGIMAKFKSLVPESSLQVFRNMSNYTISFTVKDCQYMEASGCTYYDETFYIGDLENGLVLQKVYDFTPLKADFTVADVCARRQELKEVKAALSKVESNLYPFGEYDR